MPGGAAAQVEPDHGVRAVLAIKPFRQLWWCLGLSSLGDWLGLLATTALAVSLSGGTAEGGGLEDYAAANLAVAGVLVLRLAPAIVFGPLAGVVADRWDRKTTMVVGDVLRGLLFITIPLVGELWWLLVATAFPFHLASPGGSSKASAWGSSKNSPPNRPLEHYIRRRALLISTTHKGREQEARATLQGLGHSYLEKSSRERCEGEFGEEPDLSVSPCLYLDKHRLCTSMGILVSVRGPLVIKVF